jgi:hypothetical protein
MTNQFDLNKFNSFLDSATKAISCDSNCQRNETAEQLKNVYLTSQTNLTLAEPQYQVAKQNYYTYVSGQSGYNELIEQELTEQADLFTQEFQNNYDFEKNKIQTQLETYDGLLINFNNVVDLYEKYKTENATLSKQYKDETNDVLTNDRKTYYEEQQNNGLNVYYYYFLLTFYIILVLCFGIFSLLYPSPFNWKIRIFIFLVFIVLPFFSTWILGKIIQVIYWIFNLLPKNVYK